MGQGDVNQSYYTRIDIAGPAPFNKLVFCNYGGVCGLDPDKNLKRSRFQAVSAFKLDGFQQSNPTPVFKHTTVAWIYSTSLGNSEMTDNGPDAWLWAIDDIVDAGFNDDGNFFVDIDVAGMMPNQQTNPNFEPAGVAIFSYILIQEPQPQADPKHPPHGPGIGPRPIRHLNQTK